MCKKGIYISFITASLLQAEVVKLEDMTVTATRTEEASVTQALSIDKKDTQEIELDQVVLQKDLLNSLSNVLVTQTTSGVGHMISVRTPISTNPYFLYLQDGIPVQSSGFFNHNALAYTSFESADNVEVLKGAGTALYGSDAVSAVINVGSSKPDGEEKSSLKANVGSYGYGHTYLSNSGTMSEDTNYELGLGYTKNDGYRDHTSYERYEAVAKFLTIVDEENILETSLNYNKTEAEQAGTLTLEELEDGSTSVGDIEKHLDKVDPKRKFDFARASLKWDNYSYENLDISTIGYLRNTRNQYTATWEPNLPSNDSEQNSIGLMHQTVQKVSWGKNIFGLDMEYTKGTNKYTQEFDYVPSSWGSNVDEGLIYDYDVGYVSLAPYLQSDIHINDVFSIEAGLRYDYTEFDYTNNTQSGQYGNSSYYRPENRTDSFNHFSPKLAFNYHPAEKQSFYLRYANGFRIPSATRLYSQVKTSGKTTFTLDPEITNTYELGYKQVFNNSSLDLALYYMDIDDTIIRREANNGDRYYENGGKSEHQGVELTYKHKLNNTFAASLATSYSKSNYVNDETYGDNEMASAPNTKGNLRLFYTPSSALTVMAEAQYVDSYYMDDKNEHEYEGYTIGNIKANYTMDKNIKLFAKINNITDEKYAEKADYSYGREKYTPADGRMFYFGAEYTF
ncbi:MAG: TonB-dependent receptor [Epsilonproteobacteria bacterium]|nr:MAG: TonB-dependent receptor [Campylobacterota bacterium]